MENLAVDATVLVYKGVVLFKLFMVMKGSQ